MALGLLAIILRPSGDDLVFVVVLLTLFVPWQAWVIWRAAHVMRVVSYISGKRFEAKDRYFLSSEYHDSESAALASRRRRRGRSQRRPLTEV